LNACDATITILKWHSC